MVPVFKTYGSFKPLPPTKGKHVLFKVEGERTQNILLSEEGKQMAPVYANQDAQ